MKAKNREKSILAAINYLIRKQGLSPEEISNLITLAIEEETC